MGGGAGSLLVALLLTALAEEESWREDLGLHKTGQEQRRAAHWLADLDQAINFDLDTLATDHALRRSQISQAGWTETHAKWLTRSQCAYQREGSTARSADVQTTMRDGATPVAQTVGGTAKWPDHGCQAYMRPGPQ